MPKLTKSVVDAAVPRAKQFTIWCSELKGFGVFVCRAGAAHTSSIIEIAVVCGADQDRPHGTITAEQARKLAIATLERLERR